MTDKRSDIRLDTLAHQARTARIDRRRFMEGALAMGLTVPAASALWATKVEAQTPKKGGTYRVGMHDGNTTDKLDPGTTESVYMIQLNHAFRTWLTEITPDNEIGPDGAESWEASDDAKEWTFQLYQGMEFHNGKTVTAEDVVASMNYHRGENTKSAAKALLSDVENIEALDERTVKITMATGNADLPYLMSDYHLVICPSDGEGNIDWQSGIGSGPYKIDSHEPGISTEMSRHGNYHRDTWFDEVRTLVINDPNARQSGLITGEFDAISEVDLKTVSLMGRRPDVEIDEVPSGAHCTIPMFCDVEPFNDVNVRMALKYGINREEILQKILLGHGTIGNDHPIGPTLPYYSEFEQRPYDPDKAKFHLKEAGLDSLSVDLSAADSAFTGAVDMVTLYKEAAEPCGININVVREPNDGYWSNVWLVKPFVVVQWGARPTPDVMFSLAYKADAAWNESHWQNERFNELLLQAKAELDQAKRKDMYREMMALCRDDGGTVVPFFRNRVMARRSNVKHNEQIAGNWELDGARSFQRWWMEG